MKGQGCVVPQSVRPEALSRIHRSHIGQGGCVRFAREHVFWPGMTSQIQDFVSRCETCQTFSRKQQRETLHQELPPDRPWQEVACDLFELEGKHYLITVDCHSNFAETAQFDDYLCSHWKTEAAFCQVWCTTKSTDGQRSQI